MQDSGPVTLGRAEISAITQSYGSSAAFQRLLAAAAHRPALLTIIARYIHFSARFGGCQASLAGALAVRQDLFRDLDEPAAIADNSVEVAAGIFFGAIDEFGDREDPHHRTHRLLAQATLKGLARYYQCDSATLHELVLGHAPTRDCVARCLSGYGVNLAMDTEKLFRAIGFHLGTETLADEEFGILHRFFQNQRPDLVQYLENTEIRIGGKLVPAYFWIQRHSVADAEHFEVGVASANLALQSHVPTAQRAQAKAWILAGVHELAQLEADFVATVAPPE